MKKLIKLGIIALTLISLLSLIGCGGHIDSAELTHSTEAGPFSSSPDAAAEGTVTQNDIDAAYDEDGAPLPFEELYGLEESAAELPFISALPSDDYSANESGGGLPALTLPQSRPNSTLLSPSVTSASRPSSAAGTSSAVATPPASTEAMVGIWLSCFEMPFKWISGKNAAATAKTKIDQIMKNVRAQGYNTIFCHVRPYADALYPSKYFPFSRYASGTEGVSPGYDPLQLMIAAARANGLSFHAWINPYRVSNTSTDPSKLSGSNVAVKWLSDGSGRAVAAAGGIYFNPAEPDVKQLILNGIKEIIYNYDVDGIHFDDYFYPTTSASFDAAAYKKYCDSTKNPLSLDDWRRANVNSLVASAHSLCKSKNVIFGISPAGDISLNKTDRNYKTLYADLPLWMSTPGYVDYVIPQIYFGYNHPVAKARYDYLLGLWSQLPRHRGVSLYVGLGAYRMDEPCDDSAEWHGDPTLMARQTEDAFKSGADGIVVFSYEASVSTKAHNKKAIESLFNTVKKYL